MIATNPHATKYRHCYEDNVFFLTSVNVKTTGRREYDYSFGGGPMTFDVVEQCSLRWKK
jgi:hypothetical protein